MSGSNWIWTKDQVKETPSRKIGIDLELENRLRREGINIIMHVGGRLRLKANPTLATASVFFHRFFMFHDLDEFPRELVALGCLFLAGKVDETPKKCKDICQAAVEMENYKLVFEPHKKDLMNEVMGIERVLIHTMKYDLQVVHPYEYLLKYIKKFALLKEESNTIIQTAWTFVNDSFSTLMCLTCEPQVIAISFLDMSYKVHHPSPRSEVVWWDDFATNLPQSLVADISHKAIDFYVLMRSEKLFDPPHPLLPMQQQRKRQQEEEEWQQLAAEMKQEVMEDHACTSAVKQEVDQPEFKEEARQHMPPEIKQEIQENVEHSYPFQFQPHLY